MLPQDVVLRSKSRLCKSIDLLCKFFYNEKEPSKSLTLQNLIFKLLQG